MKKFLDELNESQRKAVLYNDGPSLIIAGAGSGKTRVLTYKIAYLLENGMSPASILALTFTNKAAKEMKERISRVVGIHQARRLWMGTFHSIFSRILRENAEFLGYKKDYTIYDSSDSKNLIKTIIKEMNLDDKVYKPSAIQSQISNAKNHLITASMYSSNAEIMEYDKQCKRPLIYEIYKRYKQRCFQSGAMDFDDLLLNTNILFRDFPEVLSKYQDLFRFILVDEYQDTNIAQHKIVEMLSKKHRMVCVVGDDAQSIYSFRGANISNILNFTSNLPGTKTFKLEQNYRSTQNIVNAANSLIKKNTEQIRKNIFSENSVGEKISLYKSYSDFEEAYLVANKLSEMKSKGGFNYSDFAVLYRTNAQSRILEEAFRKRSIPYRIYGGLSFYQRKEIKDVISYMRLAINPNDEEALKRIINYPARGIGDTTIKKIGAAATENSKSYFEIIENPISFGVKINAGTASKIQNFKELIDSFIDQAQKKNVFEFAELVVRQSGIMADLYADKSVEGLSRLDNIQELINGIREFVSLREEEGSENLLLSDFLAEISLATDQDNDKDANSDKVTMMTVHASKGLEFPNVFIVGMEEDLFPSSMSKDSPGGLEEERRLFYVAITRAEINCVLSYASSRYRNGQTQSSSPSRFLKDIDPVFLNMPSDLSINDSVSERARQFRSQSSGFSNFKKEETMPDRNDMARKFREEREKTDTPSFTKKRLSRIPSSNQSQLHTLQNQSSSSVSKGVCFGDLKENSIIKHERFGKGVVVSIEGVGDNAKATVDFENVGRKQLLLKFAKFQLIG
ncbi:MAG: 3'-5' exonuclease [Bacteroidales bacterium]|nr:3'-5' exonuclease [Bacteroidales bacterium]